MYIQYPPGPKDFDWDPEKNEANILKHKIDFADAAEIFEHPILTFMDTLRDYGEQRWIGFGLLRGQVVVLAYTERDDNTRIISIRKGERDEAAYYFQKIPH